jgi:hypothetical protein
MTIDDFNVLVEQAYEAAFHYEQELVAVYERAYARQTEQAAKRFASQTVTAAWTPPIYQTLSDGMSDEEKQRADKVRDEAALAILAILSAAGVAASSREFIEAISVRAQLNFEQEIMRQLRKVVSESFDAGLSAEATATAIRERIPQVIPVAQKTAIKFVTRNAFGGNLYLTNISFGDVPLGLFETEAPGFMLYPNPTQNSVNIQLNEASVGRVLRLSDQSGRELLRRELAVGEDQIRLDLANFAAGFYLVQLQGAGGINTQKLVITK